MAANAPDYRHPANSYRECSLALTKIFAAFLLGGALLAYSIDIALTSVAVQIDVLGHTNGAAHAARSLFLSSPFMIKLIPFGFVILLFPAAVATLFATLSFVVIGRVPLWLMAGTVPLVVHRAGFSFFSGFVWGDVNIPVPVTSLRFFALLAIWMPVVVVCCWWIRNLRRPAIWEFAAPARSNSIG